MLVVQKTRAIATSHSNRLTDQEQDTYYDPTKAAPKYLEKVRSHRQINQYLESSRRDDPEYRRVLIRLLEKGYGLENWLNVVAVLSQHSRSVTLAQKRMREVGFSENEIKSELKTLRKQRYASAPYIQAELKQTCGIADKSLIQELAQIELECLPNEPILGPGTIVEGDRLLTEDDWLDPEFRLAKQRFDP